MAGQLDLALGAPRRAGALSVTQLVRMVRETLEARFEDCWVAGEISNARRAPSNHLYFTLKDQNAAVNVVMFATAARRLRFKPADGMKVVVRGRINVYEARGTLQFYAEEMEPRGVGALQLAFEQLKKKLAAEGLFDAARKRELPFLPRTIGIVSALGGAGLRDMLRVLFDRFPNLRVIISPARVQGDGAGWEIARAIEDLNRHGQAEVIIVGRGGGSLEDLWAFNEEIVARAIFRSRIPIVSAVGHEIDFTIADFVADKRAPTPTAAAHLVAPSKTDLRRQLAIYERGLEIALRKKMDALAEEVKWLEGRVKHPQMILRDARQRLDEAAGALDLALQSRVADARRRLREFSAHLRSPVAEMREMRVHVRALYASLGHMMERRTSAMRARAERATDALARAGAVTVERRRGLLGTLATRLDAASPLKCLERGYAVVVNRRDGRAVMDARKVEVGDELDIRLRSGRLRARAEGRDI